MARTAARRLGLGVMIVLATVCGGKLSLSKGLGQAELGQELNGKRLFEKETFGGNGRTCQTCHSKDTGTLTLEDVQRIIDKGDPDRFLIHDALDDDGVGTTRVRRTQPSATRSRCRRGSRWRMTRTRRRSPSFAVSHRPGTRRRSTRFCFTTDAHPRSRSRHLSRSTTIIRTLSNRRPPSSMPLQNSSERTRTSSPRLSSEGSPQVDRRRNCHSG